MTDRTVTQNLTRTTSGDDPRQVAAYLKALAIDADQRMAAQFHDLGRSQTPPFAVARVNTPIVIDTTISNPWNGTIPFDTVDIDTNGMIDLSKNAYQINLNSPGHWWVGGYAILDGLGSANADVGVYVRAQGDAGADYRHNGLQGNMASGISYPVRVASLAAMTPAFLTVTSQGPSSRNTTTVTFAELWACKVRDL